MDRFPRITLIDIELYSHRLPKRTFTQFHFRSMSSRELLLPG